MGERDGKRRSLAKIGGMEQHFNQDSLMEKLSHLHKKKKRGAFIKGKNRSRLCRVGKEGKIEEEGKKKKNSPSLEEGLDATATLGGS